MTYKEAKKYAEELLKKVKGITLTKEIFEEEVLWTMVKGKKEAVFGLYKDDEIYKDITEKDIKEMVKHSLTYLE